MNQGILPILNKGRNSIKLPSLSDNIHVLMNALADDNIGSRQLAAIIRNYPEIAVRLLFLANSAWSAPISPITTIENACSRLGISVVKSVSIALAVSSHFNSNRCPDFDKVRFWTDSMLVADGASLLAARIQKDNRRLELQKTAQTAGVLHNLGLLWLAENLPKETGNALRMVLEESSLTVSEALFRCAGTDYCSVGGWIGQQWKIPEILTTAMQHHLEGNYREQCWEMVLLVGSAAKMVAALQKNGEVAPINSRLHEELGLDYAGQREIFQKLLNKLDNTRELARTLFK